CRNLEPGLVCRLMIGVLEHNCISENNTITVIVIGYTNCIARLFSPGTAKCVTQLHRVRAAIRCENGKPTIKIRTSSACYSMPAGYRAGYLCSAYRAASPGI